MFRTFSIFQLLKPNKRVGSVVTVLLDNLLVNQLVKKIFTFYEKRKIIKLLARLDISLTVHHELTIY